MSTPTPKKDYFGSDLVRGVIYGLSRDAVDDLASSCMIYGEEVSCLCRLSLIGISATDNCMDFAHGQPQFHFRRFRKQALRLERESSFINLESQELQDSCRHWGRSDED
jgi:hypothetical protein